MTPTSPLRRNLELAGAVREGRFTAIEAVRMMVDTGPIWKRLTTDTPDIARAEYHAVSDEELAAFEHDIALKPKPPRNPRKPPLDRLIRQAERAGKTVTSSSTTPDGHTLTFGEPNAAVANPWDEVLKDAPDKKRPA